MLYIEPRLHKRIVLTDTDTGKYITITTIRRRDRLVFGISAPLSIDIKHIEPTDNHPVSNEPLNHKDKSHGKETNSETK